MISNQNNLLDKFLQYHLGDGDIKAGSKRLCRLLHSTYRTINKWLTGKVKHPGIASRYGLNMVAKKTQFKLQKEEERNVS